MAAEITHVMVAERCYPRYFAAKNKHKFFLGNNFPDIRYLANLDRFLTHLRKVDLKEARAQPDFQAGVYFHSLIDLVRVNYFKENQEFLFKEIKLSLGVDLPLIFHSNKKIKIVNSCLKYLEDELVYNWIENRPDYIRYFREAWDSNDEWLNINKDVVTQWYQILLEHLSVPPSTESRKIFLTSLGSKDYEEINRIICKLKENDNICRFLTEFYLNIENYLVL